MHKLWTGGMRDAFARSAANPRNTSAHLEFMDGPVPLE